VRLWRQQPVDLHALTHDGHPAVNSPQGPCSPALTPDNSGAAVTTAADLAKERPASMLDLQRALLSELDRQDVRVARAKRLLAKHGYHVIEDVEGSCPTCGRET
jgi:hypothetical protein